MAGAGGPRRSTPEAEALRATAAHLLRNPQSPDEVVVWVAQLSDIVPMARRSDDVLSAAERAQSRRRRAGTVQDAFTARRVLRRVLVAAHLGCPVADVE